MKIRILQGPYVEIETDEGRYRVQIIGYQPPGPANAPGLTVIAAVPHNREGTGYEGQSVHISMYYPADGKQANDAWRNGFEVTPAKGTPLAMVVEALLADPPAAEIVQG